MGIFSSKNEVDFGGVKIEAAPRSSSGVSSDAFDNIVRPSPEFAKCYEYYKTIGKIQNTTDTVVAQVISRDWFYEGKKKDIKLMEEWEEQFNLSRILENLVRNWIITGNHIIGLSDWQPVQLSSIDGLIRNPETAEVESFVQNLGGEQVLLDAKDFMFNHFIESDRQAWGLSMYHSLFTPFTDLDGKTADPIIEVYRQMEADMGKIIHKYASPRVIYTVDGVQKDVIRDDIAPLLSSMKAGDRTILNQNIELQSETVDPRARFEGFVEQLNQEVESGLQSSSSRLITRPSAMADAATAISQDDDRVLGIMEKIRRWMNGTIVPHITGTKEVEFKWGASDKMELEFPTGLRDAIQLGIVSPEQAKEILSTSQGWKIPHEPKSVDTPLDPRL